MKLNQELKDKNIGILGFGKEGKSSLKHLKNAGARYLTVLDKRTPDELTSDELELLNDTNAILGNHYMNDLEGYDSIIKAPGVSPYQDNLCAHRSKLTDQTQIFFDNFKGKIIAVTGTKGKSTTTSLIYELLKNAGMKVGIVGNIGKPALDYMDEEFDFVVYELSSYMLELADINPFLSIITNIYPEHVDYHKTLANYIKAKLNVIGKDSIIFYNPESEDLIRPFDGNSKTTFGISGDYNFNGKYFYRKGQILYPKDQVKLIGDHNMANISSMNAVADILGISQSILEKTANSFIGLKHRLEKVTTKNGITFYDDAISTTPQSTIAAIDSLGDKVQTIFLGGNDRGCHDFSELARKIYATNITNIVLFPDTGKQIKETLREINIDFFKKLNILETDKMKDAVDFAFRHTGKNMICLLSCASSSYNLWKNYEAKGDDFLKCIEEY